MTAPRVVAVARDDGHRFSKPTRDEIVLVAGLGVEGDAHAGVTVQHASRALRTPDAPNLRQVHVFAQEMLDELAARGFEVAPGEVGENITTVGIDVLALPTGTLLHLGAVAVVEVTGLRNPCAQLDENIQQGLRAALLARDEDGSLIRRGGIMGVVRVGGPVRPGDPIDVELPPEPHVRLEPV
jgi:MOSC domain-containing protein YiiM